MTGRWIETVLYSLVRNIDIMDIKGPFDNSQYETLKRTAVEVISITRKERLFHASFGYS